ncbi:hypothetical protein MHYP_G00170440 [Metynnis hypsauchen]
MIKNFIFWSFLLCFFTIADCPTSSLSVSARVGSSTVLPCDWRSTSCKSSSQQESFIRWKNLSDDVFVRDGTQTHQGNRHEGRVDVPEDELRNGNCSLVLKDVRKSDEGNYNSQQICGDQWLDIQIVSLLVEELADQNSNEPQSKSSDAGVNCPFPGIVALFLLSVLLSLMLNPLTH